MAVKNLILDLGGVIVALNTERTLNAFRDLGLEGIEKLYSFHNQEGLIDDYEVGRISTQEFRQGVRDRFEEDISDEQIDHAWNAMLQGIPQSAFDHLELLAQEFRLFCLSNTNDLHLTALFDYLNRDHPEQKLIDSFEKEYFSHEIGLRKPDKAAFQLILDENDLLPTETVFVDDKTEHLGGATEAGLYTFHFRTENELTDLFIFKDGNISQNLGV